jgi:hypothetical protein
VQVSFNMRVRSTAVSEAAALAEAADLAAVGSPSNLVYRLSFANLLNGQSNTTLQAGTEVMVGDVTIVEVIVDTQQGVNYILYMSVTVKVKSASGASTRRMHRHLLQESGLLARSSAIAAMIQASTASESGGEGGSLLASYINASAAAAGVEVASGVDGLASDPASMQLTSEVDPIAALEASLRGQWKQLEATQV